MTNFLFKPKVSGAFGEDLVARNIQRGRHHGLPGYNTWRTYCGLPEICSFSGPPPGEFGASDWAELGRLYEHPADIDLFPGGIAEKPRNGAGLTGPTFNCLKSVQFERLKKGDRFFFTHPGQFSRDQLDGLKARRLSDVICDNTDIAKVPSNVFLVDSEVKECGDGQNGAAEELLTKFLR